MIEILNLTKKYKDKKAVSNVSLNVMPGKIHGFIGHNGAGKTTTLKAIVGIHDFDEGEINVFGKSVKKQPLEVKQMLSYIPDNPDVYPFIKAIDYIHFVCDAYGVDASVRKQKIEEYAELFEISSSLNQVVSSFSHGMKQKLVIIAALIHNPKVLILDEPFVGLDPKASHSLKILMRELTDNGGCILFSTHVLEVAQKLCDEITIIKNGEIVVSGSTQDVVQDKSLEELFLSLN